jgi:hypothetical protein
LKFRKQDKVLKTRGTTDEHGWTLIEEEIKAPEIKPEVRAAWRCGDGKKLATKMQKMQKNKKRQKKRKFVGLEWHATLSAMRTWIGGHPDTRMNSRIRVSADPSDRQMPVSATCVRILKNLVNLVPLCGQLSVICGFILRLFFGILGQFKPNQC